MMFSRGLRDYPDRVLYRGKRRPWWPLDIRPGPDAPAAVVALQSVATTDKETT